MEPSDGSSAAVFGASTRGAALLVDQRAALVLRLVAWHRCSPTRFAAEAASPRRVVLPVLELVKLVHEHPRRRERVGRDPLPEPSVDLVDHIRAVEALEELRALVARDLLLALHAPSEPRGRRRRGRRPLFDGWNWSARSTPPAHRLPLEVGRALEAVAEARRLDPRHRLQAGAQRLLHPGRQRRIRARRRRRDKPGVAGPAVGAVGRVRAGGNSSCPSFSLATVVAHAVVGEVARVRAERRSVRRQRRRRRPGRRRRRRSAGVVGGGGGDGAAGHRLLRRRPRRWERRQRPAWPHPLALRPVAGGSLQRSRVLCPPRRRTPRLPRTAAAATAATAGLRRARRRSASRAFPPPPQFHAAARAARRRPPVPPPPPWWPPPRPPPPLPPEPASSRASSLAGPRHGPLSPPPPRVPQRQPRPAPRWIATPPQSVSQRQRRRRVRRRRRRGGRQQIVRYCSGRSLGRARCHGQHQHSRGRLPHELPRRTRGRALDERRALD